MKRFVIVVTCILLCFIFVFTCIGYAAISDTLQISGNATVTPPEAVFISGAEVEGNATVTYSGTSLFVTGSGSVTVSVTFFNNTAEVHRYNGISVIDSSIFSIDTMSIQRGAEIAISGTLGAEVTFSITDNVADGNGVVFQFVKDNDYINDPVVNQFEEILNNEDDFNNLNNAMNSQYNGGVREDTSYIGNIAGDEDAVNGLFNGLLSNNQTVIIKKEENKIDDAIPDNVEIITLYSTTNEVSGGGWSGSTAATIEDIRVSIFISINGGEWEHIKNTSADDEMFVGQASSTYYDYYNDHTWFQAHNSFDTGNWKTTSPYTVNGVEFNNESTVAYIVGEYLKGIP